MKKNRHYILKSLMLMILAMFTFSIVHAQEEADLKEDKTIKIKMVKSEDGEMSIDTTIVIKGDFDGDWKALIDEEDLLKQMEEIEIEIESDGENETIMIMSPDRSKHSYMYVTTEEGEDGEVRVEVKDGNGEMHDVWVTKSDGDSTITYMIKTEGKGKEGEKKIMVWHAGDGETHDVLLEKMDGEDGKVMIVTVDDDGKAKGTELKKEVIIIKNGKVIKYDHYDHDHDCDHHDDKEKKKKKKKK